MKAKIWAIVKALCRQEQTWCKLWREGERKIHKTPTTPSTRDLYNKEVCLMVRERKTARASSLADLLPLLCCGSSGSVVRASD